MAGHRFCSLKGCSQGPARKILSRRRIAQDLPGALRLAILPTRREPRPGTHMNTTVAKLSELHPPAREALRIVSGGVADPWLWEHSERVSRLAQMIGLLP